MSESKVYEAFQGVWLQRANEYYVAKGSASAFAAYLAASKIPVLGIEGFKLADSATEPVMSAIADYSSRRPTEADIMMFLRETESRVTHYNFVLDL